MASVAEAIEKTPRGQMYWPTFERLELELATRLDRQERLDKARSAIRAV